jgi:hypothetical protein
MFRKLLSLALTSLLISPIAFVSAAAQTQTSAEQQQVGQIRIKVIRLGTGKQARVEVRLKDGSRLKGYIGAINEDHFTVIDSKHGTVSSVSYAQVQQLKNANRSPLIPLGLAAGVVGGVMLLVVISLRGS